MGIKKIGKGFNFPQKKRESKRLKATLPRIVANDALNHFLLGFRKGGGQTDAGKWAPRKRTARRNIGRALLVDTGALRRDVKVRLLTFKKIVIGTTRIIYARRHNEGLKGMPKREFLGDSKKLDKKLKKLILKELDKILG